MNEVILTAQNFEAEVINSSTPVLVDFWATWCGPCKMTPPLISQIAEKYAGAAMVSATVKATCKGSGEPVIENSLEKYFLAPVLSSKEKLNRPRVPNRGVKVTMFSMNSAEILWLLPFAS